MFEVYQFVAMNIKTPRFIGNMWTILILLASALFGECKNTTIHSFAGDDVLLSCSCRQNQDPYIVWQIGDIIVDYNISGQKEPAKIDPRFRGRTHLFLPKGSGNCTLQLTKVTKADEETYTCHYFDKEVISAYVTLTVSDHSRRGPTDRPPSSPGTHEVPYAIGGVLIAVLLLTVFLAVRYREKCRRSELYVPDPQEAEQADSFIVECV